MNWTSSQKVRNNLTLQLWLLFKPSIGVISEWIICDEKWKKKRKIFEYKDIYKILFRCYHSFETVYLEQKNVKITEYFFMNIIPQ